MSTTAQLAEALALVDDLLRPWKAGAHLTRDDRIVLHAPFQDADRVHRWQQRRAALDARPTQPEPSDSDYVLRAQRCACRGVCAAYGATAVCRGAVS